MNERDLEREPSFDVHPLEPPLGIRGQFLVSFQPRAVWHIQDLRDVAGDA